MAHKGPSTDVAKGNNKSESSGQGLPEKGIDEIKPGMLVFAVNENFTNISNFFGSKLSRTSKPDRHNQRGHFELVLRKNTDTVETIMMTSFSGATQLEGAIPKDRWKFCVPIDPATVEDNEQYGPVEFLPGKGIDKYGTGGWFTVQSTSKLKPHSNGKFRVKETDIDPRVLATLLTMARGNVEFFNQSVQEGGRRITASEQQAMLLDRSKGKGKTGKGGRK
ncbi:uncharacterized protein FOMMEDRAFT_26961 [Fomitiporia mediterranea MF3/22]|uniref:uncharacterized protein n=1 Tax=Fomitiporia mediterranea (strain MF3/22) TaxID=694068 RepID=UPI000440872F|nr:uncharacterized protein FOMMEDRAFT_26961 [Fomitiporia mediterranea MF3/22]EJD06236.1 hypothetical protein FOMMEDRAFT_26961 [Fomitiporia mediterranea MF3/22]